MLDQFHENISFHLLKAPNNFKAPEINMKKSKECDRTRVRVCETSSEIICKVARLQRPPMPWHLECGLACTADAQRRRLQRFQRTRHPMGNKSSLGINFLADCGERWRNALGSGQNLCPRLWCRSAIRKWAENNNLQINSRSWRVLDAPCPPLIDVGSLSCVCLFLIIWFKLTLVSI